MTRTILTGVLAMMLVTGLTAGKALAADATSKPAHAGKGRFANLNLTDDQKAQIKQILQQAHKDAQAATDKADKKKIMQAAFEKIRDTVLTADQRKQLAAQHGGHRHPLLGKLGEQIGVTDQQKQQIKDIWAQAQKDLQDAKDKDAKKQIIQAAKKKIFDTVLTADQRTKLEALRKAHKGGKNNGNAGTTTAPTT